MTLHNTDGLIIETKTATESLPDPTLVTGRSHWLTNTGYPLVATWSSIGALPFLENGVSVATITVSAGEIKTAYSNGTQWVISSGAISLPPTIVSAHHLNGGIFTVNAGAHAATGGFIWLLNPVASTVKLEVRKVYVNTSPGPTAVLTPPTSLTIERMTFTGIASGPSVVAAVRDTAQPVAQGTARLSTAGIVPTSGAPIHAFSCGTMVGVIGVNLTNAVPVDQLWPGDVDQNEFLILRPGQGMVFRQDTAGAVLLENRSVRIDIEWSEVL